MDRRRYFHPPQSLHWVDSAGIVHLRPFVRRDPPRQRVRIQVRGSPDRGAAGALLRPRRPSTHCSGLFSSNIHLFGVEDGAASICSGPTRSAATSCRDCCYGGQVSLTVGLVGHSHLVLARPAARRHLGLLRRHDRLGDHAQHGAAAQHSVAVPHHRAARGLSRSICRASRSTSGIVAILAFIGWAGLARVIRGLVLSIRRNEYVTAAEALGVSRFRIITRHILPNTWSFVIVAATISVPGYILGEVVLSFLGVGVQEPASSWGNMLNQARSIRALTSFPWLLYVPGPGHLPHRDGVQLPRRRPARRAGPATRLRGQVVSTEPLLRVQNLQTHFFSDTGRGARGRRRVVRRVSGPDARRGRRVGQRQERHGAVDPAARRRSRLGASSAVPCCSRAVISWRPHRARCARFAARRSR